MYNQSNHPTLASLGPGMLSVERGRRAGLHAPGGCTAAGGAAAALVRLLGRWRRRSIKWQQQWRLSRAAQALSMLGQPGGGLSPIATPTCSMDVLVVATTSGGHRGTRERVILTF